ncbi:MAG TPA: hemolysin family protein [Ktedonobacterales bacterium]
MESDSIGWPHLLTLAAAGPHFSPHDWFLLTGLFVALIVAAGSAAAETALTSVSHLRIRNLAEEGDARAKRIERLLQRPQDFLTTILVMSNLSVITASTLATIIAVDVDFNFAEVISTILLSLVVLIFCEITPKSAAVQAPERWARWLIGPVETLIVVLMPIVRALTWITARIVGLFGARVHYRGLSVTEDELRLMVEVGREQGVIEAEERQMIDNVFELSDTAVHEVMVPRVDMITLEADSTIEEATALVLQGGRSRVPVYDDSIDNIIGVLYAKDLLRIHATKQHPISVRPLLRPAYFVPESKRLDDLLREMKQRRVHIAIVVDEYGSTAGMVTIEDLVEEIVGDIKDEYDVEEHVFERVGENEFIVDAKLNIGDFQDLAERELPEGEYDTVGGFVYHELDKIPVVGDTVRYEDLALTVMDTKGRRLKKIKVVRELPVEAAPGEDEAEPEAPTAPNGESRAAAG